MSGQIFDVRRQTGWRGVELHPVGLSAAMREVYRLHRHLPSVAGGLAAVEVIAAGRARPALRSLGVGIVGRPVSRILDGLGYAEVTRVALADDAPWGSASAVYSWAAAWAWWGGFTMVCTYTLESESGASLEAAGWVRVGRAGGGQWGNMKRPRKLRSGEVAKSKWRWQPGYWPVVGGGGQ